MFLINYNLLNMINKIQMMKKKLLKLITESDYLYINFKMDQYMMDNGKTKKNMEKGDQFSQIKVYMKVIFLKIK